jgi:predicted alpha/beta-fold hydrolase
MMLSGHLRTMTGHLGRMMRRLDVPEANTWQAEVEDPLRGSVRLTGALSAPERPLMMVILHGLGGHSESGYVRVATAVAHERGFGVLRLNLRGADRRGEDFYHAGLTADLKVAIDSPELAAAASIVLLGYSLGGHIALRYLIDEPHSRVAALAAVCPPLDLEACCTVIDRPSRLPYRRYMLKLLKEIYREVAARHEVALPVETVDRIRLQREFDHRVIAPRHGFDGVDDYYRQVSVGPHLDRVDRPALLVWGEQDPMVPVSSIRPFSNGAQAPVDCRFVAGGHLGFAGRLDLGVDAPPGLENQLAAWLSDHC